MSGAISGVGKVFKAVTKSTIGKIVVAGAVAYFTAGLGTAVLGSLGVAEGMSATLATVLSGAIDGAVAGGLTSAITGGDIGKGVLLGGAGGAVFGGVKTALGDYADIPTNGPTPDATPSQIPGSETQNIGLNEPGGLGAPQAPPAANGFDAIGNDFTPKELSTAPDATSSVAPGLPDANATNYPGPARPRPTDLVPSASGGNGLLGSLTDFAAKNPAVTIAAGGALAQGVGSGLLAKAQSESTDKTARDKIEADQQKQQQIAASHEGMGLLGPQAQDATLRPKPAERFDPRSYGGNGRWVYDPGQGKIVWAANG